MKLLVLLCICVLLQANIYEKLNDFAYTKTSNKDISLKQALIINLKQDNENCLKILIEDANISILNVFNKCKNINKKELNNFLNKDFINLYKKDLKTTNKYLLQLKNIMKDIMISYKINRNFNIHDKNIKILKLDNKTGGDILFKVNNQDCVQINIVKENNKMTMYIKEIENLDRECKILTNSPYFKEISYDKYYFKSYILE